MTTTDSRPGTETAIQWDVSEPVEHIPARDFTVWRWCTHTGSAYIAIQLVFWALVAGWVPPPRQSLSAAQIGAFYRDNEASIRVGMEGVMFSALFFAIFSLAVYKVMRLIEGRGALLAAIQLFGGVVASLVTMAAGTAWLAGAFRAGARDDGVIQLMNDLGWLIFDVTGMAVVLQCVAFGVVCFYKQHNSRPLYPRWLGYFSFWAAFSFLSVYMMPFFFTGPFSWNGLLTLYVAVTMFCVWTLFVIGYTLRAINTVERDQMHAANAD